MADEVTPDQLVEAAAKLGKPEFQREDLAAALGVKKQSFKESFREARQGGRFEKVRDDENGVGVFKLGE